jgi:DNA-binding MltR family transcriptional regulator
LRCALVGASYLDASLGTLLKEGFVHRGKTADKMLEPGGLLSEFRARSDLAYCLGLVNEDEYRDLSTIAEIRNRFAHSYLSIDFKDNEVKRLCGELQAWRFFRRSELRAESSARRQFQQSVVVIGDRLNNPAVYRDRKNQGGANV